MFRELKITIGTSAISAEAVRRACVEQLSTQLISIVSNAGKVEVTVRVRENQESADFESAFMRQCIENQVRIDTEFRFRTLRELIVAQAFAPCDNLQEMIEKANV